ncbi:MULTISPECIES: RHS repeat protein [unclassified Dyella]|uniref:RHS repeat protein n=1 Tax=unclassified Dyella TaxID=2634549 RepID=UPI000CC82286|nr:MULTISPECIES: RHS repeat protein [unclassified Dyella]MDR3445450.1 RHS repeat protein [Dyella sp.]PMQ02652.1 hypothetical protein DyAD56_23155 [Dyella sp. AD56]
MQKKLQTRSAVGRGIVFQSQRRVVALVAGLLGLATAPHALAQSKNYAEEFDKKIKAAETFEAAKTDLFGEKVNLATGATTFHVVDVSLPGNNALPVSVGRNFTVEARGGPWNGEPFGDWDLDVPYIGGVFVADLGWQVQSNEPPYGPTPLRCSAPTSAVGAIPMAYRIEPWEFWHGYHLVTPSGSQEVLVASSASNPRPTDGAAYPWVTSQFWHLSCLPSLLNGDPGEGFLARAPDGTKYYFNWMVKRPYASILKPWMTYQEPRLLITQRPVVRQEIRIYPTRVEDVHGNWVQYSWSGNNLRQISSSDGRTLNVNYRSIPNVGDKIASVSDGARTWTYDYEYQGSLTSVTLPDSSVWAINFKALDSQSLGYDETLERGTSHPVYDKTLMCSWMRVLKGNDVVGSLKHPSGAVGEFAFDAVRHGRTFVQANCHIPDDQGGNADGADVNTDDYKISLASSVPARFDVEALKEKRLSGPGLPTYKWSYSYQTPVGCFTEYCNAGTPTTKSTTVVDPLGARSVYTYGVQFEINDGQLLKVDTYAADGTLLQVESSTYLSSADAGRQPFSEPIGSSPESENAFFAERLRPLVSRALTRDGITMTSQVNGFDAFARATSTTKSNSWYRRTDATSYYDHTGKWVVGQVARVVNSDTGLTVSQTDYDATTTLPARIYSFGKLQASMAYYGDGTLKSSTEGNNHTTSFTNWKRGLPQLITYPDTTTKAASVDDFGFIRSLTDENGFVTGFDYDSMGRVTAIRPPEGYATSQVFELIGGDEYGLSAGHWRQTATTGNRKKVTYFDALWRPVVSQEEDIGNSAETLRWNAKRYDFNGQVVFTSYPRNPRKDGSVNFDSAQAGESTSYDALGRVTRTAKDSEKGALVTTTEYLYGVQTRVTNPRGFKTTTGYFFLDEPRYDQPVWIVAPEGSRTDISRDVFGKPLTVTRSAGS